MINTIESFAVESRCQGKLFLTRYSNGRIGIKYGYICRYYCTYKLTILSQEKQGCSGAGTRGNGVPISFSRIALIAAVSKWLFYGCVPIPFLLAI